MAPRPSVHLPACYSLDGALGQSTNDRPVLLIDIKGAIGFVAAGQLAKALEQAAAHGVPCRDRPARHAGRAVDLHARDDSHNPRLAHSHHHVCRPKRQQSGQRRHLSHVRGPRGRHGAGHASGGRHTDLPLSTGFSRLPPPSKPSPDSDKQSEADPTTASARKSINDAVAYIRSLAELRGRNADWGEKAVREAATLTASAALKERVVDVIAKDIDDLLSQIDGRSVTTTAGEVRLDTKGRSVVELKPDWKMQLMSAITDPNIALILLMIGIYGILFEFWSPGAIAPGVIGGISLIVALTALAVLPVNYAGLALLLFGVALMVAEAFTPGFGIAGLGGIAAFAVGALFLFDPAQSDVPIAVSWQVVAGMAVLSAAFFAGVMGFAVRARHRPVRTGAEQMIGSTGEVVSWTENAGRVHVDGEMWEARSNQSFAKGQKVRVVSRTGLTLTVEAGT